MKDSGMIDYYAIELRAVDICDYSYYEILVAGQPRGESL